MLGTRKCYNVMPEKRELNEVSTTISPDKCLGESWMQERANEQGLVSLINERSKGKETEAPRSVGGTLEKVEQCRKRTVGICIKKKNCRNLFSYC